MRSGYGKRHREPTDVPDEAAEFAGDRDHRDVPVLAIRDELPVTGIPTAIVDADSGLVHTVVGTAANVSDVTQAHALVHGDEHEVFGDAGYQGVQKREETQTVKARWHIAMRPGRRRALDKETPTGKLRDEIERVKARIRAKVEHPFASSSAISAT